LVTFSSRATSSVVRYFIVALILAGQRAARQRRSGFYGAPIDTLRRLTVVAPLSLVAVAFSR